VTSQIDITIGPDLAGADTPAAGSAGVWSRGGKLHIRVDRRDVASIYAITGQLVRRIDLPEGSNTVEDLKRGVYIVTLKDGSVHKVIIQ
ncbi:MAG: T9SS type A sorting domain-containing protein, partial [Tannerella sp.]|nr:T9SS type A sorting domain-containing protein [Tannerella sp.]